MNSSICRAAGAGGACCRCSMLTSLSSRRRRWPPWLAGRNGCVFHASNARISSSKRFGQRERGHAGRARSLGFSASIRRGLLRRTALAPAPLGCASRTARQHAIRFFTAFSPGAARPCSWFSSAKPASTCFASTMSGLASNSMGASASSHGSPSAPLPRQRSPALVVEQIRHAALGVGATRTARMRRRQPPRVCSIERVRRSRIVLHGCLLAWRREQDDEAHTRIVEEISGLV